MTNRSLCIDLSVLIDVFDSVRSSLRCLTGPLVLLTNAFPIARVASHRTSTSKAIRSAFGLLVLLKFIRVGPTLTNFAISVGPNRLQLPKILSIVHNVWLKVVGALTRPQSSGALRLLVVDLRNKCLEVLLKVTGWNLAPMTTIKGSLLRISCRFGTGSALDQIRI